MKTKCKFSMDANLYNDGEFELMKHTKTETIRHIRTCSLCQKQLREYRWISDLLVEYFKEEHETKNVVRQIK